MEVANSCNRLIFCYIHRTLRTVNICMAIHTSGPEALVADLSARPIFAAHL